MSGRCWRVTGKVQGVGFRAFVVRLGTALGVRGAVRNDADGAVTCYAHGRPEELDNFRRALEQGPARARVDRVEESELASPPDPREFDASY